MGTGTGKGPPARGWRLCLTRFWVVGPGYEEFRSTMTVNLSCGVSSKVVYRFLEVTSVVERLLGVELEIKSLKSRDNSNQGRTEWMMDGIVNGSPK